VAEEGWSRLSEDLGSNVETLIRERLREDAMSHHVTIPADARVLVADGRKALFLSNVGNTASPNLQVEKVLEAGDNPPTHSQGSDRPGRTAMGTQRSAVEQTDWHKQGEARFAATVMKELGAEPDRATIIVAAPAFLAELRRHLPQQLKSKVLAEIPKDLTHLPVGEIEKHLAGTPV
jgi:protein required for attachment to host cells